MLLPTGYSDVPAGKIAAVVTCLDMQARPPAREEVTQVPWRLRHEAAADVDWYRELFRRIGGEWLWFSRLAMPARDLQGILHHPAVEVHALDASGRDEGLIELDFREPGQCELAFFGVSGALQGHGAGRWLMNRALERAWARPIERLWVHTCTLDHPDALGFYLRTGFRAYARRIEIADDPRLTGLIAPSAAQLVPVIAPER